MYELENAFAKLKSKEVECGLCTPDKLTSNAIKCVDGGICNHKCVSNSSANCFRQSCCGTLSGEEWDHYN